MVLLAGFYGCGNDEAEPTADSPDIPDDLAPVASDDFGPAPAFQLADLDGNLVSLNDFQGQVVAVNFWATWCAPCRREIPDFVEAQEMYQDRGFTMLGLSRDLFVEDGQFVTDEDAVRPFVEEFNVNHPVLWDTANIYVEDYDGFGMPTTVILDRNHRIRFRHNSIVAPVTLEAEILMLLNEAQ